MGRGSLMSSTLSETKFEFNLKTKTRFGIGEALSLGQYLKELSIKRVGIVIDSAILDLDYSRQILDSIRNQDFLYVNVWAYDLKAEPDYESLDRIKMLLIVLLG
jgi:alcohol dehydrogenase class IV